MTIGRAIALAHLAALSACSDGGGSPRMGSDDPCPTTLQEVATQVLQSSCIGGGCHSSVDRAGALDLEGNALELELIGREAALCNGETRVIPGDGEGSLLIAKLRGTADCGAKMPIGGEIATATIDCMAAWIDQLEISNACETCGGTACIDLQTNADHCGSCETACGGSAACVDGGCACPNGLAVCDSGCADLDSDPANCGACASGCGDLFCLAGECLADCGALTECTGSCVDLTSESNHCGACGRACGPGSSCVDGQCQCGGATVSFATDVQPIFDASCASMGCHDGIGGPGRPGGGGTSLDLTSGNSYESLLSTTTTCGPAVAPRDPEGSVLIGKLTGTNLCMGSQMPKGDSPLAVEPIDTIAVWICQGATNN
ncbi:MAG: hypothetical protein OEM15_01815 [Myxococcales bacterium]|nr:hypothetical protein [Myxococcales bacterium]MDH3482650.1 hypothetical protein [Myxococcales bacterium]